MNALPLGGLKVLVTRPRDQTIGLAQSITTAGGVAMLFPLLDISAVADPQILREQLSRLSQFELAVFISPNAVQYGMAAITAASVKLPAQIATVGQGSARELRKLGIANVIAPTEKFDSESLLSLAEFTAVAGKKIIIIRGDAGRELLGDTLKARGATVEYAACYQRSKAHFSVTDLLREMPDVISVTSSEALMHLYEMVATPQPINQSGVLTTPLFVPHPRIAELALQQGWKKVITTASGDEGLLASLIAWRNSKGTI